MPIEIIPSFLVFCFVGAITPGPANLTSLYTALQYGKEKALKQWVGLFTGFTIISILSVILTYCIGSVVTVYAGACAFVGAAYLLYLAFHILRATYTSGEHLVAYRGFRSGLFVQLTNAKIMIFCFTALSSYVLPYNRSFKALLAVGLFLPFTGPVANLVWLFAGAALQRFFVNHTKAINIAMFISLVLCAASLISMGMKSFL
ncbi:MAG: LysE family transporter [Treponema sp.]|nr:LysE family transporter [Treponema sp.]